MFEMKNKDRKEKSLNTDFSRDGVLIRLPWRREVYPNSVDSEEWEEHTWDNQKIKEVGKEYQNEIPRILLGCSWLREVVLDINIGIKKSRFAWVRNFNHREFEEKECTNEVFMKHYVGEVGPLKSALQIDIDKEMEQISKEGFHIISNPNIQIQDFASGANLLPSSHILLPKKPSEFSAYTPIALQWQFEINLELLHIFHQTIVGQK